MSFMNSDFIGAPVWLWAVFFGVLLGVSCAIAYYNREKIKEHWLKFRWPEKTIEVCIHYPGNPRYKSYWRLIPLSNHFDIANRIYRFDETKQNRLDTDYLAYKKPQIDGLYVLVDGIERKLNLNFMLRRKNDYPQIHYTYNESEPLDFSLYTKTGGFMLDSHKLNQIIKTDLWNKALDLKGQNAMIIVCIFLGIINIFFSIFILAKLMGWIK